MDAVLDILLRGMNIVERLRNATSVTGMQMIFFSVILVFGIINCLLGYRLLRFWMMLFGFILGAALGFGASFFMGVNEQTVRIAVSAGIGILLAVIVFISYKAGIFVLGAGLGLGIAVYVLHPTSSLVFFFCLLAGVGLGSLAMKWAKEVIITGTSLLGGAMAGMSLAKLGGLADFPYGIGFSAGFAALGMLIQFATNRSKYEEEPEEEEEAAPPKKKTKKVAEQPRYIDEYEYEKPVKSRPRRREQPERNSQSRMPVDFQVGEMLEKYADDTIESEKTIVYRPRHRKEPELDLPLDSGIYHDSYGKPVYPKNSMKKRTYTVPMDPDFTPSYERRNYGGGEFYADLEEEYEDPIDEEELEDEIIREMMEDEDRETILPWKKHREKSSRKESCYGKRS